MSEKRKNPVGRPKKWTDPEIDKLLAKFIEYINA